MTDCWWSCGPCSIHDADAALEYAKRLKALRDEHAERSAHRHAHLLREAAHHRRVEGPDQRSQPRRKLRHQPRAARVARLAERPGGDGAADRDGVPRPDFAAVRRGPGVLGSDWRANDREPGPSRAGQRPFDARGLQERDARDGADRRRSGRRLPGTRIISFRSPSRV